MSPVAKPLADDCSCVENAAMAANDNRAPFMQCTGDTAVFDTIMTGVTVGLTFVPGGGGAVGQDAKWVA